MLHRMMLIVLLGMLALIGCEGSGGSGGVRTDEASDSSPSTSHPMAAVPSDATPKPSTSLEAIALSAPSSAGPRAAEPGVGGGKGSGYQQGLQSGTLTAASFDDVAEPRHFEKFARNLTESRLGGLASRFVDPPLVIAVRDGEGRAVPGAQVVIGPEPAGGLDGLVNAGAARGVVATSRTDGRAVFLPGFDGLPRDKPLVVRVVAPGTSQPVSARVSAEQTAWTIDLPGVKAAAVRQLDLAFVIDCTGSMSDELEYLKVELRSIVEAVTKRFPEVKIRFALVVYRDQGDEYVTRSFDFTSSLANFRTKLGAQSANGGGDTPEAVHSALHEATKLEWSLDAGTARVLFHVADAEPHDDKLSATLSAAAALRTKGVSVYPVASSGVAELAEFIFRVEAMVTGAQYCFLTDDSGVGNAHAEPHFPAYDVQKLNKLMVRLIESELSGRAIPPAEADVVRRVRNSDPPVNAPVSREGNKVEEK